MGERPLRPTSAVTISIVSADLVDLQTIFIRLSGEAFPLLKAQHIRFDPFVQIHSVDPTHDGYIIKTDELRYDENYKLSVYGTPYIWLNPDRWLQTLYSDKPLGYQLEADHTSFAVFAPRASKVVHILFESPNSENYHETEMIRDKDGVWELVIPQNLHGKAYGYRVFGKQDETEWFNPEIIIADPYSPAVTSINTYHHSSRTLIFEDIYDWENDSFLAISPRDLIIYEAHVRDLTAHPSAECSQPGTFSGLNDPHQKGGLPYLKSLGINALELLPIMKFGAIEPPYHKTIESGITNTWNPYARNHWGYMTSLFFAPEPYFGSDGHLHPGQRIGSDGRVVTEIRDMVKGLHKEGIAVLMDVVYNHASQYDNNPLKLIDKKYYFRLTSDFHPLNDSGCGNDIKSERPMTRRLIIDSVLHWMRNYHVDGFRFDLANILDKETCRQILQTASSVNPKVILIAEPWGGGYDPYGFSDIGWMSWNDQFRNGIKGWHPLDHEKGYIFGTFRHGNNQMTLIQWINGTLRSDGGLFRTPEHVINYLASHDDHNFGDFVRLAIGKNRPDDLIDDGSLHIRMSDAELRIHQLAAGILMISQGAVMIGSGDEYGRSKVTAATSAHDPQVGRIDHNTYSKDNETNYLNFQQAEANKRIWMWWKELIEFRKSFKIIRHGSGKTMNFYPTAQATVMVVEFEGKEFKEPTFAIAMNSSLTDVHSISLPKGDWLIYLSNYPYDPKTFSGLIHLPPSAFIIFQKEEVIFRQD